MTLTLIYEFDLHRVTINRLAEYLGRTSFRSKVIMYIFIYVYVYMGTYKYEEGRKWRKKTW